jgi:uncharacterized protein (DUF1800 family)
MAEPWTEKHVRRLFWRAGFGATPEEAARWAKAGKAATLKWILDGERGPELVGPVPSADGKALDPRNEWGHDVLWWLDRMVRTRRPIVEKMTLFWHDHFATREQETPLMLAQNKMLRKRALGSFPKLLEGVTRDPAMQLFLSLADSTKWSPNENYARELMELFTLGKGYSEKDIREAARALTGFRARWSDNGFHGIYYDRASHDTGVKRVLGKRGRHDWRDVLKVVCANRNHAPYITGKLWAYFVTQPLDAGTQRRLAATYKRSGMKIKPVVAQILAHPALYHELDNPDMVKSPTVFLAGALRSLKTGVDQRAWSWLLDQMGQYPFSPPTVAGWEWGPAWLSTNTMKARFSATAYMSMDKGPLSVADDSVKVGLPADEAIANARAATGDPWTSAETDAVLRRMATDFDADIRTRSWGHQERADMRQRVLRHLLISGPDAQLH